MGVKLIHTWVTNVVLTHKIECCDIHTEWPSAAWTWISLHIIVTKYRRKQLKHSPLWTTVWCMLTLLFSIAVKYLLHLRNLRFQAHTLSCCRRWTLQMGCQPFQQHENYGIALASLHVLNTENKFENTFSSTQHFVVYITLHALSTAWCTLDKARHLTAFGAWDSTPHSWLPQRSWWGLVLAEMHPAQWVTLHNI